jgi:hypothetical protein
MEIPPNEINAIFDCLNNIIKRLEILEKFVAAEQQLLQDYGDDFEKHHIPHIKKELRK